MRNYLRRSTMLLGLLLILVGSSTAAEFIPLGDLPGGQFHSYATGLSDDGTAVVGYSEYTPPGLDREAFRWTAETDMVGLGRIDTIFSKALGVSADGSVVVGYFEAGNPRRAFRWTEGSGAEVIGAGVATAVSGDGSIIIGQNDGGAFRWTRETGVVPIETQPGGAAWGSATDLSADGSVLLVRADRNEPFRWSATSGAAAIELPDGRHPSVEAYDLSADGSAVVGGIGTTLDLPWRLEAFRWTEATGTLPLGDLPGGPFRSEAFGVSGDGSIVVGHANMGDGWVGGEAFIWDETNGMQNLQEVLIRDHGLGPSLDGWTLQHAEAISADGRMIVGYGTNPSGQTEAWLVAVPEPSSITLLTIALLGLLAYALRTRRGRR